MQDIIDKPLEIRGGIGQTKGHDKGFKQAIASPESSLPFFTFCGPQEIICSPNIESGIVASPRKLHWVSLTKGSG